MTTEGAASRTSRQPQPQRHCTWCGGVANSFEDVLPNWLLKRLVELYGHREVKRRAGLLDDPKRVRVDAKVSLRLRLPTVCQGVHAAAAFTSCPSRHHRPARPAPTPPRRRPIRATASTCASRRNRSLAAMVLENGVWANPK